MPRILRVIGPAALLLAARGRPASSRSPSAAAPPLPCSPTPARSCAAACPIAKLVVNLEPRGHPRRPRARLLRARARPRRVRQGARRRRRQRRASGPSRRRPPACSPSSSVSNVPCSFDATFSNGLSSFLTSVSLGQAWLGDHADRGRRHGALLRGAQPDRARLRHGPRAWRPSSRWRSRATRGDRRPRRRGHLDLAARALRGHLARRPAHPRRRQAAARRRAACVTVLARYSTIALICFVVVAASGYVSAEIRVGTLAELPTPYGILVLVKVAALVALGLFGLTQRRFLIGRLQDARASRGASGGSSPPSSPSWASPPASRRRSPARRRPSPQTRAATPTPAEILTGEPLPAPLDFERLFTSWNFDLLWVLVCAFALFFYLAGVWRLRRRGDRWPVYRTVLWVLGHRAAVLHHQRRRERLREVPLPRAHARRTWCSTMAIPVLLVPGAPVTLGRARDPQARRRQPRRPRVDPARRALALRRDHLATRSSRRCCSPASLWVFYYTPLFRWATDRPRRARVDDRALPHHRLPVRRSR